MSWCLISGQALEFLTGLLAKLNLMLNSFFGSSTKQKL